MDREITDYCAEVLGRCEVVADRSWPHGEAQVLELLDPRGRRWILKRVAKHAHYQRELRAYREWVPALGDRAPALLAHNEEALCFVISVLPGEVGRDRDPDVFRQAGVLTRRFHQSAPALPDPTFAPRMADALEEWLSRGGDVIDPESVNFARRQVARLSELAPPLTVPCHWDNTPRNWLVDREGTVRFIDFGHSRRQAWVLDLHRLYFGFWHDQPVLRESFLEGYGKNLDDADIALLERCGAQMAVANVVWAREHRDAQFEESGWRTLNALRAKPM